MPMGTDKAEKGVKKGYVGGISDKGHQGPITDDVFAKNWASPLNANNKPQPGPDPTQGADILQCDAKMGGFKNPLEIPNVDMSEGGAPSPSKVGKGK